MICASEAISVLSAWWEDTNIYHDSDSLIEHLSPYNLTLVGSNPTLEEVLTQFITENVG